MRTALVLVIVILIVLALYNPDMEDFKVFAQAQSERLLQPELGNNVLGRVLSDVGSSLAGSYVDRITERENYVFFSTYNVDLDGAESEENEWRFLGIAGQFLELEQPAFLRREAESQ